MAHFYNNQLSSCLVKTNPVNLETGCTVILALMVNVI